MIHLINFRDEVKYPKITFNVTSGAESWTKNLSPFFLKPIGYLYSLPAPDLPLGEVYFFAENIENAWQFSKVYKEHLTPSGNPLTYIGSGQNLVGGLIELLGTQWVRELFPEYSFWEGEKLSYIEARKRIYIPLYSRSAKLTIEYEFLKYIYQKEEDIYIKDYDVYDRGNLSWEEIINNPNKKMGHGFVLAMMLEGYLK